MQSAFSFANVSKHYGDLKAVHDLTFRVNTGEVVGFVGPNGAGKTTAINLLLGFIAATRGTISLSTPGSIVTPSHASRFRRDIGFVSGDMALFENLTGKQYLSFLLHRSSTNNALQLELISRLQPILDKKIKDLSRGNKQKIALIGALQHNPSLLVLDEPTSGLDPLMQDTFLTIISEHAARGATVFMSSHILSEVASACSRVIFMKNGKILIDKPVEEIEKESGKMVTLSAPSPVIRTASKQLIPGMSVLESTEDTLQLIYTGDTSALTRWLVSRQISDLTIVDRSLDDIFKDMYLDSKESTV